MEDTADLVAALRHVAGEAGTPPPSPSPISQQVLLGESRAGDDSDDSDVDVDDPTTCSAATLSDSDAYDSDGRYDDDDDDNPRVDSCAGCTLEFFRHVDPSSCVTRFYNYTEDGLEYDLADTRVCSGCRDAYCDACAEPGRPSGERAVVYVECGCVYCVRCVERYEPLACARCAASVCAECHELGARADGDGFMPLCAACWREGDAASTE